MEHNGTVAHLQRLGYSDQAIQAMAHPAPAAEPKPKRVRKPARKRGPTCEDCQQRDGHGECEQKRRAGEAKTFVAKSRGTCFWFLERHEEESHPQTLMELCGGDDD